MITLIFSDSYRLSSSTVLHILFTKGSINKLLYATIINIIPINNPFLTPSVYETSDTFQHI